MSAAQSSALVEREIVPGKSIGHAALGMSRATIQKKLKSPDPPQRSQFGNLYYLAYHYPYRAGNPGKKLLIVFNGLGKRAKAGYMVTIERSLGTRPEDVGVGDRFNKMLGSYPGVNCYHSDPDGTRNEEIQETDDFECELRAQRRLHLLRLRLLRLRSAAAHRGHRGLLGEDPLGLSPRGSRARLPRRASASTVPPASASSSCVPELDDAAVLEHGDLLGLANGREAVGDRDRRPVRG